MKKIIHVAPPEMLGESLVSLGMPILIFDKEYKLFYSNIIAQKDAKELEIVRELMDLQNEDLVRDSLLSSLSHELRNPLAPIRNMLELIRLTNEDPALTPHIDVLDRQFEHMAELITQLLDSTRFAHGKIELSLESVDAGLVIDQVVKSIRPLVDRMGLALSVALPSQPIFILADRLRIEQVMANLLHNSVKFTPRGGTIDVDVRTDGKNVSVSVSDSGAGITSEEMGNIFKPYYQSERMRSENKGLGVGLDLVSKILTLHNGTIQVVSDGLNSGSKFIVELPLLLNIPEEREQGTFSSMDLLEQKKKVLVVDDNPVAADTLVQLLAALGYEAQALYHPQEVPLFLEHNPIDVAFLDIGMPEMSGYELVKILREGGHDRLPIIALSGYGQEDDKRKAKEAGFTSHLTKPMGMKELRSALAN